MATKNTPKESLQGFWERFTKEMAELDKTTKKELAELDKTTKKELAELDKTTKKEMAEHKKEMAEHKKEIAALDKKLKKEMAELAAMQKSAQAEMKQMRGHFDSQWGKFIETLVEGDLIKLLVQRKVNVYRTATNVEIRYKDQRGKVQEGEVDVLAVDTTHVVPVEVKSTLKVRDVNDFLKTLQIFKLACPEYKDKIVYGAVAYLKANEKASVYAQKKGLFVIRATGSSASIVNAANFKAKAF